jgi:hypothetical protein
MNSNGLEIKGKKNEKKLEKNPSESVLNGKLNYIIVLIISLLLITTVIIFLVVYFNHKNKTNKNIANKIIDNIICPVGYFLEKNYTNRSRCNKCFVENCKICEGDIYNNTCTSCFSSYTAIYQNNSIISCVLEKGEEINKSIALFSELSEIITDKVIDNITNKRVLSNNISTGVTTILKRRKTIKINKNLKGRINDRVGKKVFFADK